MIIPSNAFMAGKEVAQIQRAGSLTVAWAMQLNWIRDKSVIDGDHRISSADRAFECTSRAAKDGTRNTRSLIKAALALKRINKAPRLVDTVEHYPCMTSSDEIVAAVRTLILRYAR